MEEELKIATRQSYGEALKELGAENKDVVVLDADLSTATKTSIFAKEFPERFFDARNCRTRYDIYSCRHGYMRKSSVRKYICSFCSR